MLCRVAFFCLLRHLNIVSVTVLSLSFSGWSASRRQPVRAFFLIQMRPPARESLYFKASEPLQNSLHRILSLVSGFLRVEELILKVELKSIED